MNDNFVKVDNKQAEILYNAKILVCDGGYIKGKKYNKTFSKVKNGFEKISNLDPDKTIFKNGRLSYDQSEYKEISKRSLSRTRDNLIGYVSANKDIFNSFLTLTFADNVTDITQANKLFKHFISSMKRRYPDFKYIGVPEYQKRGAVHYHILSTLHCDIEIPKREVIKTYNTEKKKWFEIEYYEIPYWTYGFSTAFPLDMTDDNFNVALYLAKYLYKDIDNRLFGRNKILKSNGLNSPSVFYLTDNKVYEDAMNYIAEKGYDLKEYHYNPTKPYEAEMDINECHMINNDDISALKMFLSGGYYEQGNKAFGVSVRKSETQGDDMPFYW